MPPILDPPHVTLFSVVSSDSNMFKFVLEYHKYTPMVRNKKIQEGNYSQEEKGVVGRGSKLNCQVSSPRHLPLDHWTFWNVFFMLSPYRD